MVEANLLRPDSSHDSSEEEAGDWSMSSSSCVSGSSFDSSYDSCSTSNSDCSDSSCSSGTKSSESASGSGFDDSSIDCFSVLGDMETLEDELAQLLGRANSDKTFATDRSATSVTLKAPAAVKEAPGTQLAFEAPIDVNDEDMLSKVKQDLLSLGNMFASQGNAFRERAQTLASINYLAANVPNTVLDHLGREVRHFAADVATQNKRTANSRIPQRVVSTGDKIVDEQRNGRPAFYSANSTDELIISLPYVAPSEGAVLFLDITGFTAMSALHGPETVTKLTNAYFERIVKHIFDFDGDIQKYAGDALFAEWRANQTRSLEQCVYLAAVCTCKIADDLSDFPIAVRIGNETLTVNMNHHSGLGCGETVGIHIGDDTHRREYLHVGDSIEQATNACKLALSGEVVASTSFGEILKNCGSEDIPNAITLADDSSGKLMISTASTKEAQTTIQRCMKKPEEIALSRAITRHVEGLSLDALNEYRRLIALYCHPVVKAGDLAAKHSANGKPENAVEPELRNVCVAFLGSGLVLHKSSNTGAIDHDVITKINRVRNIVSKELINFHGHSQSFIDDKGFSILLTFGLRGCTFPEMVPQIALPATLLIRNVLEQEENIMSKIGATYGRLHCGFVGGESRHEYTVLGPSANSAARLMTSPHNSGFLVDESICMQSCQRFRFNPVASIVAKGFIDPIMTYAPVERLPPTEQLSEGVFVGRRQELSSILLKTHQMLGTRRHSEFVLVTGPRGGGKSSLLMELSATLLEVSGNELMDGLWSMSSCMLSVLTPYAPSMALVARMLRTSKKESVLAGSCREEISVLSRAGVSACVEQDAFVQMNTMSQFSNAELELLGLVITRIIRNFAATVDLLLITVDDCHWLDKFSWEVFRNLLLETPNLLLIGTAMSSDTDSFRMNAVTKDTIWCELQKQGRLSVIEISELQNDEIEDMVSRLMDTSDVSCDLLNDVVVESGGVPLYVRQALQGVTGGENESICSPSIPGWSRIHNEILLHQLDDLPCLERRCLNVVACMGPTFLESEVSLIWEALYDADEVSTAKSALEKLVDRGLLRIVPLPEEPCFEFRRQRWKNAIRELVPESKKRYLLGAKDESEPRKKSKAEPEFQRNLGALDGMGPAVVVG